MPCKISKKKSLEFPRYQIKWVYKKAQSYIHNKSGSQYKTFHTPPPTTHMQCLAPFIAHPLRISLPPLHVPNSLLGLGPGSIPHSVLVAYKASATTDGRRG